MANNGHESSRKPLKTVEAIKDDRFPNMWRLQFREGGKLPTHLEGMFNSLADAQRAINYYNEGFDRPKIYPRAPKRSENKDGEEKDAGRVQ